MCGPSGRVGCVAFFFNNYLPFLFYAVPLSVVVLDPLCDGPAVAAVVCNRSLRGVPPRSPFGPRGPWAGLSGRRCRLSSAPFSGWLCVSVLPCGGPFLRPCLVLLVVLLRGSPGVCPVHGSATFLAWFPLDCLIGWLYSFWVARCVSAARVYCLSKGAIPWSFLHGSSQGFLLPAIRFVAHLSYVACLRVCPLGLWLFLRRFPPGRV